MGSRLHRLGEALPPQTARRGPTPCLPLQSHVLLQSSSPQCSGWGCLPSRALGWGVLRPPALQDWWGRGLHTTCLPSTPGPPALLRLLWDWGGGGLSWGGTGIVATVGGAQLQWGRRGGLRQKGLRASLPQLAVHMLPMQGRLKHRAGQKPRAPSPDPIFENIENPKKYLYKWYSNIV